MDAWSWAGEVRVYVAALRQAGTEQIGREPDGRLARWLKWAQQYADLVDPLEQPETLPLDGSSSPVFSRFCRVVRRTFWPSTVCCARDQVWGCRCSSTDLSTWTRARCMLLGMPMKLVSRTLLIGITLLTSVGRVYPQAPRSLSPAVATIEPIFPSWEARGDLWGNRPSSVAFPRLRWSTDIAISAAGLTGYTISRSFAITRQTVPQQGLDRSTISWGLDRNIIGNPSTSADKASDVTLVVTMVGAPVLALLTQPGVHGFENVVRRPLVLYGESLLLAEAGTRLLKRSADRPRPFTYLPESERPASSAYNVNEDGAFLSMPSGHATISFTAASYAAADNLLSHPSAGWQEHVAVASIGGLLAGATGNLRIKADQHFPSDVLVGGLIGTVSGVSIPLLHSYVFPDGRQAPRPRGHAWLETTAGYLLGVGVGVGLSEVLPTKDALRISQPSLL